MIKSTPRFYQKMSQVEDTTVLGLDDRALMIELFVETRASALL
jgi:hypothetical protein